jgi:transcriptional regulator of acetoin/glycerol metabolism
MHYTWPGNVRELKSAFEFAFVSCQGATISIDHLPINILGQKDGTQVKAAPTVSLDDIRKKRLIIALEKSGGNQSEAARLLDISRTSVWSQMKRFNLRGRDYIKN